MSGEGFDVRIYCIRPDGYLESLMGADIGYFHGAVPNVGDTFAKWGLNDVYTFFSVQRRYFINSASSDHGWCVVVREIESAPQMEAIVKEWGEETEFWRDVAQQEKEERDSALRDQLIALTQKKRKKPAVSETGTVKKTPKRRKPVKPRQPKNDQS